MSLYKLNGWLNNRLSGYVVKSAELQSLIGRVPDWQHRYLTESLVSEIWLTWCLFSRHLIHKSLRGGKARDNTTISPRVGDNSWQRIGHECARASQANNHQTATPANFSMRKEPTWGDINSLIKIISALSPANSGQLLTAFGLPFVGPKHIQIVRNCSAHKTVENLMSLRTDFIFHYSISRNATPYEVAWSNRVGSNDIAINLWIHEMKTIGNIATATA